MKRISKRSSKKARPKPAKKNNVFNEQSLESIITKIAEKRPSLGRLDTLVKCPVTGKDLRVDRNSLELLTVEPGLAFVYWDIAPENMVMAAKKIGPQAKLSLKLQEIAGQDKKSPLKHFFIETFDKTGNRFFRLENDMQRFQASIGMKGNGEKYVELCTARLKFLPAESISRPGTLKWLIPGEKAPLEYIDADQMLLKKILGPYFHDLLMRGRFSTIIGSSTQGLFQDITLFYPKNNQ